MGKNIFLVFLVSLILCFAGLHNKFPLLTGDSGVYINTGFNHDLVPYNGSFYGLFIAHSSWGRSIWFVILSQSFILSVVLYYIFRYFPGVKYSWHCFTAYALFLAYSTVASVTASSIDPGIFASVTILTSGLLFIVPDLSRRDRWILLFIAVLCALMDKANLLYLSIVTLPGLVVLLRERRQFWPRYRNMIAVAGIGWLLSLAGNRLLKPSTREMAVISHKTPQPFYHIGLGSVPYGPGSASLNAVNNWFNWEAREYLISRQYQNWLYYDYLNYAIIATTVAGLIYLVFFIVRHRRTRYLWPALYLAGGIAIQIVISAILYKSTNPVTGQVAWILTLPVWICATAYLSGKNNYHVQSSES